MRICSSILLAAAIVPAVRLLAAQPAPTPQAPAAVVSTVPVAIQALRRAMLDPPVNALAFRTIDTLFTTRRVGRSGAAWRLPRNDQLLAFDYSFAGATYSPEEFLDRTFTNALLVMKDGRIVYENYRNNSNETTRFMAWSMTKSITSILIGAALQERRMRSLDDQIAAYLPDLKGGGYRRPTRPRRRRRPARTVCC